MTSSPHGPGRPIGEAEFNRIRWRIRLALGALALVTLVGVLGYVIISKGQHGVVDAIYMTVITLTTVGFGEIIDMTNNPVGRMFTVVLLLVGMGIVAYTVPMLAAFVIEGQLNNIFARRRMQKTIKELENHYVICGDDPATWHVVEELVRTKRPVVLVTPSNELVEETVELVGELPYVSGDPSHDDVLMEAGIDRAAGIVFSMAEDKDNVLGVLTARRLNERARIVAATELQETAPKLRTAGADAIVSPSKIGGLRIASELVRPKVVSFLDQMLRERGGSLRVEEVTVPETAKVDGQTLESLRLDDVAGAVLLAVRRPDEKEIMFKPPNDTPIEPGLTMIVMAEADGLERLKLSFERATGAFPSPTRDAG